MRFLLIFISLLFWMDPLSFAVHSISLLEKNRNLLQNQCEKNRIQCQNIAMECTKHRSPQCITMIRKCSFERQRCRYDIEGFQSFFKKRNVLFRGASCSQWFENCRKIDLSKPVSEKDRQNCLYSCLFCDKSRLHCSVFGPVDRCWQKIDCSNWMQRCQSEKIQSNECFDAMLGCYIAGPESCKN